MLDGLGALLDRRPPPLSGSRSTYPAQVMRSDASGVFVTPLGGGGEHRLDFGATYRDTSTCPGGTSAHSHPRVPLPRGALVLVTETDRGLWAIGLDLSSLPA